ncbi:MAG: D-alanyl-D-alanine carboxypeptidase [Firmicutes bacterium]|nr:D-alanyl-D-alanine carboxypeptidase [Bacillota bacterium]
MAVVKKMIAATLVLAFMFGLSAVPVYADELELEAESAILIEAETGTVLFSKNADARLYPASLTKIMTLLIAMEEMKQGKVDWDTRLTASQKAWETGEGGLTSTMFLNIGQEVTFEELLKGIAVVSANDACVVVAEHLYGSEAAFVQKMNERAEELGLENTHFMNSHGLHDPNHYMSAADVARLSTYFLKTQPEAAAFLAIPEYTFNEIRQFNNNPLLGNYPGVDGIKTGYTPEAGHCLSASSLQGDMRLIAVVMGNSSNATRRQDSEALLDYGFREFELLTLYEAGEVVTSLPVIRGEKRELAVKVKEPVAVVVARGQSAASFEEKITLPESLAAPVEAGQSLGKLQLFNSDGDAVSEVELLAAAPVERLGFFKALFRSIGDFFAGLWQRGREAISG